MTVKKNTFYLSMLPHTKFKSSIEGTFYTSLLDRDLVKDGRNNSSLEVIAFCLYLMNHKYTDVGKSH